MAIQRLIKSNGLISLTILIIFSIFVISNWSTKHTIQRIQEEPQLQQQTYIAPNKKKTTFSRIEESHQQILYSALSHIRLGHVANRTPDYSTPPLLVSYSNSNKTLSQHLLDIVDYYYFSMLQPGAAFAYAMTDPIKFDQFFEPLPGYMSMQVDQANKYLKEAKPNQVRKIKLKREDLVVYDFQEFFSTSDTKIIERITGPSVPWLGFLSKNPYMKALRDKYRLNHIRQTSDGFWIISQLLFSQPSEHLKNLMWSHIDLMGGRLDASTSSADPEHRVTNEFRSKGWFRLGVRLSSNTDLKCLARHISTVCQQYITEETIESCHVFVSASNRSLLDQFKNIKQSYILHEVAPSFGFADLNEIPEFDQDDTTRNYARIFMDWLILSRMDYLVGQANDDYIKTAAWAAQVQTDLVHPGKCNILPMTDW